MKLIVLLLTTMLMATENIYNFTVKDGKGNDVALSDYKGKVLLIVNTATRCGFTPQYDELEALYEKYNSKGLEILDFPCNQFGEQAPGSNEEIHTFCTLNYNIKFAQLSKIDVNGSNASPLFTYLKSKQGFKGFDPNHKIGKILIDHLSKINPDYAKDDDIKWNFTKFLVDKEGNVVKRFEPTTDISVVEAEIKSLID
jgi:glutathione peroxidase